MGLFCLRAAMPPWQLVCPAPAGSSRTTTGMPWSFPTPYMDAHRRWQKLGFWRTALQNQCILVAWKLGVDVHTLASVYYGKPLPPSK